MIYKNEDGSIYKIELGALSALAGEYSHDGREISEVLNYLLQKVKEEAPVLPKANRGEVVTKGG